MAWWWLLLQPEGKESSLVQNAKLVCLCSRDKITPGTQRFTEGMGQGGARPQQIYLSNEYLALLGHPTVVEITIVALDGNA